MKKTDKKVPFKLNILGFKLETTIAEMHFWQIVILIGMGIIFILALIILLRGYVIMRLSISAIIDKISKLEILKIIKSRLPKCLRQQRIVERAQTRLLSKNRDLLNRYFFPKVL